MAVAAVSAWSGWAGDGCGASPARRHGSPVSDGGGGEGLVQHRGLPVRSQVRGVERAGEADVPVVQDEFHARPASSRPIGRFLACSTICAVILWRELACSLTAAV